ncbi:TIGR02680 family protein [Nocardia farcinica]|uniref:TIGR02680 family protein n=1 Tax=Nocardia farcinica (strain IFM 10152) TaxID=247156 RepID=Q5YRA6_NOCFA|nr:TIGR02680 family protein [Nocardia farcinica]BAD59285.1 hypothetical protein NFA_44340 [Nocardia farcinica IFM 10152]
MSTDTTDSSPLITAPGLPRPTTRRWKPLRAGLADLFYYDNQEFRFRDGRLLLRGNNGAGKSKVLALLLPFLLDGELAPHRVEPDADSRKRMEWNLLLGGEHPHSERVGYTWLEFGRVEADGTELFCTIGCGLKAVASRGIAAHWYFVSSARMGVGLRVLDDQGYPVSRDRLGEQLVGNGERYDTAGAYRRAVDEALFGLGESRYGVLVDLLIRLRQPQLSKKPSEKVLSDALTESLPPIDQAILADVAEAFRSLQEDRDELADMQSALDGTRNFLTHYREYARTASRRRTTRLRQAHSRYERVGKDLGGAKDALATADDELRRLRADTRDAEDQRERLAEQRQALYDSSAAGAARELERARDQARDAQKLAADRAGDHTEAQQHYDAFRTRADEEQETLATTDTEFRAARQQAAHTAAQALLTTAHTADIDAALDRQPLGETAPLRRAADRIAALQSAAIKKLRTLIAAVDTAEQRLTATRARIDKLDTDAAGLAEAARLAEQAVDAEAARLTDSTSTYLRAATELALDDLPAVLDDLTAWARILTGESPVRVAVAARASALADELTRAESSLEHEESVLEEQCRAHRTELNRLREGGIEYPPTRHTRSALSDSDRDGTAFWQLTAFADRVPETDRAGLEAALEAAGILDARIGADGTLRAVTGEVILSPETVAPGRSLTGVLEPALDPADSRTATLTPAAVTAVLTSIGLGTGSTHHTWVDVSGDFQIGVLHGAWTKTDAQYIGAVARERFRLARITALEANLDTLARQLAELAAQRRALTERKRALRAEAAGLPDEEALRGAHRRITEVATQRRRLTAELADAAADAAREEAAVHTASTERDRYAGDAGLPVTPDALDDIAEALTDYRVHTAALWIATTRRTEAAGRAETARADAEQAHNRLLLRAEAAEAARIDALKADERHRTLDASVGAEVAELRAELARVATAIEDNKRRRGELATALETAVHAHGIAEGKLAELTEQLDIERADRDHEITAVHRFAETGLFEIALTDTAVPTADTWSAAAAISFARAAESELAEVAEDDKTLDRAARRIAEEHKTLTDLLSAQGNTTSMTPRDDGLVVDIVFRGRPVTVAGLAETLEQEVGDRNRLLTAREREVLENHLVDEVAAALQELILAAEDQVLRMNTELASRPTSTGMRLRLNWVLGDEAPTGARAALRQLRQTADLWNETDRAAVGEFLQQEIERVRAEHGVGTWLEHLTAAFDYRRWHKFVIELQQRGQWRPATGPASGGERVLAASVPLFAAASSHYSSAGNPHAPRLVMLDEAFAGVDDNARAKYFGLLAAFDLDVVMTSEREWGCYPEVPGLAIAQLARTDEVAAVLVTPWEWDGSDRHRMNYPEPAAAAAAGADAPADAAGLF